MHRFLTARAPALACIVLSLSAQSVSAAEPAAAATTQVYDLAYFRQYDLSNAEDMLRRIPGVTAVLDSSPQGGGGRGLGAGSEQILINGKRLASKSTSAAASLRRIPASSVARIELIRGSTDEVRSEGLVINVVMKEGVAIGGVGNFEAVYRFDDDGWSDADGLISWSDSMGRLSYVVAYENAAWSPLGQDALSGINDWSRRLRDERFFYPSGALQELRPQHWRREFERNTFTGNATYEFAAGDSLRVNALFEMNPVKLVDVTDQSRFSSNGSLTGQAVEDRYNKIRTDTFELGGEFEKKVGRARLKIIALHTRTSVDQNDFRNRTESTGLVAELGRSGALQHKGEDVVQTSIAFPITSKQTLTFGLEGARNTLTQQIEVYFDLDRNGRLEPIAIPTAFARVQELRAEGFVAHSWQVNPKLTVDSSLYFEISRLTTNYPEIPVRTLKYLKPRVDIRYSLTPTDRLRIAMNRTLGQLEFAAFVPTYNVVDNRIDLGNPEIMPPHSDQVDATLEHRLPNDGGTLQGQVFYRVRYNGGGNAFEPFGFNSAGLPQSRRGTVPKTPSVGYQLQAAVRLTRLGLPGAQLTGAYTRSYSHAIDLFNLRSRKAFTSWDQDLVLGFRHDLTSWRVSYGVNYFDVTGYQLFSDVRQWETFTRGPRVNAFVEKALWGNVSLRLDAYNLNGAREYRERTLYSFSQLDGAVSRTESFTEHRDRRFAMRLRGKF